MKKYIIGKSDNYINLLNNHDETIVTNKLYDKAFNKFISNHTIKSKVLIIVIGHPGSGKSYSTEHIINQKICIKNPSNIYSLTTPQLKTIPVSYNGTIDHQLMFNDFININFDNIIDLMDEYHDRLILNNDNETITIDINVIHDYDIRKIVDNVRMKLFTYCIENSFPIIFETLGANINSLVNKVIEPAFKYGYFGKSYYDDIDLKSKSIDAPREAVFIKKDKSIIKTNKIYLFEGQIIVIHFYNNSLTETIDRVKNRFENTGRYVSFFDPDNKSMVEESWKETQRKLKVNYYANMFMNRGNKERKYNLSRMVDFYCEVQTDNNNVKLHNIVYSRGFILGNCSKIKHLITDEIIM
jgi:hypothetical protein